MPKKHLTLGILNEFGEFYTVIYDLSEFDLDHNPFDRETVANAVADLYAVMQVPKEGE